MQHYKNNAKKKLIKKLFIRPIVFYDRISGLSF